MQKTAKEGWGLFCLRSPAQLHTNCRNRTLLCLVFFSLKPWQKGFFPLSSIRDLREGLQVAPACENGVGIRPGEEILLPYNTVVPMEKSSHPQGSGVMFPEGVCWADELSNVEKAGEQAGFRNLAFVLQVLGKLSGIQPDHDVVQICLSSGGRENLSWP